MPSHVSAALIDGHFTKNFIQNTMLGQTVRRYRYDMYDKAY